MDPQWISVLSQIPIVGAFIWFVFHWQEQQLKDHNAQETRRDKRDAEMREWLTETLETSQKYMREISKETVGAIERTTSSTNMHLTSMEKQIARNTTSIAKNTAVILCNYASRASGDKPLNINEMLSIILDSEDIDLSIMGAEQENK